MVPPGWDEDEEEGAFLDGLSNGYHPGGMDAYDDDEDGFYDGDDDFEEVDEDAEVEVAGEEDDDLEALIDEGEALIEEGEYEAALELFREASERFPDNPLAAYHVGQTALMMFTDGIDNEPNWKDDDDLVALYEEALGAFDMAISLEDDYYPAYNGLGALHMLTNATRAAVEAWERSLAINADQDEVPTVLKQAKKRLKA